jgi:hypothetical protein
VAGTPNTGGGGGAKDSAAGGIGGSGLVIVRYLTSLFPTNYLRQYRRTRFPGNIVWT